MLANETVKAVWPKILAAGRSLVGGAIIAAAIVYIVSACGTTRSPIVTDKNWPKICRAFFECIHNKQGKGLEGCFSEMARGCKSTLADEDCETRTKKQAVRYKWDLQREQDKLQACINRR